MVHRTYVGLGPPDHARRHFSDLTPWVLELKGLQAEFAAMTPDWLALNIALDALQTAAYHFTRRPDFFFDVEASAAGRASNNRLRDRDEARAAFVALRPYAARLREMQLRCRPYGADYCVLALALDGLFTSAFHFTRDDKIYAAAPPTSFS